MPQNTLMERSFFGILLLTAALLIGTVGLTALLPGNAEAASEREVLQTYSDIAEATYEDSLLTAKVLRHEVKIISPQFVRPFVQTVASITVLPASASGAVGLFNSRARPESAGRQWCGLERRFGAEASHGRRFLEWPPGSVRQKDSHVR